jgi:PAS domain S-box-containing protein
MEAEATIGEEDVTVHLREGTPTPAALPESLVRHVMRTQETVMLDDASSVNPFSADPYIVGRRARSILCLPLINQAKLTGILYLENNLAPQAFTRDRVTMLKVLASQAAISLENTRLYRDLEDREAKIRRFVDANILGIFMWNLEGAIVGANEAFLRMLQYGREDLVSGRVRWTDLTPAEWRECDERAVTELNGTGTVQPYEKELFRKDGSRVPVLIGGALFQDGGHEGVAFVLDLTERKRAEAEITALNESLMKAQEQERTRIAGELHDGVMQQISALTVMLGTGKYQPEADARQTMADVQRKLIEVGAEVRQLSHNLHPPMLNDAGLPETLRVYCEEFSRVRNIPVSCHAEDGVQDLSLGAALALYRIAQEALGNAAAHGAAQHVDVRLTRSNGRVTLTVSDDGRGFDPNRIGASGGLGLINMRERARQLNGTFELDSRPGRGTTVRVTIPFRRAV